MDSAFSFLSRDEATLLNEILHRRNPEFFRRMRLSQQVSRLDADEIVNTLGTEFVNHLDDDWEPTKYGKRSAICKAG
jgi:hypothetical protein